MGTRFSSPLDFDNPWLDSRSGFHVCPWYRHLFHNVEGTIMTGVLSVTSFVFCCSIPSAPRECHFG